MAELKKYVLGLDPEQEQIFVDCFKQYRWNMIREKLGLGDFKFDDLRKYADTFIMPSKALHTLRDYPAKVREVAREDKVPLIDLNAMSKILYQALGGNLDKAFNDGTHHNNYGSYQLAKCVVQGIRENKLDLAGYIVNDFQKFDPGMPDSVDSFDISASTLNTCGKPRGN